MKQYQDPRKKRPRKNAEIKTKEGIDENSFQTSAEAEESRALDALKLHQRDKIT